MSLAPNDDRQAEKFLVKSRSRLDELARELAGAELQQRGPDDFWAPCPFHTEDTPSFHVRPRMGMFKCFGCGESGDVFSFVQKLRGIGFREALEFLAERAGITLGSLSPEERRRQMERKRTREGLGAAARILAGALASGDSPALRYMRERGFEREILERFDVGFVPGDLVPQLGRAGLRPAEIEGMGFTRAFVGRVSFGIRDAQGGLVGFGARTLDPDGKPKYVNTRDTAAFNKSRLLYGLDKAARRMSRSRRAVVMEGYTDVMMAHQRGVDDAVATMGTSLTTDHVKQLRERASNVVFVFDGDDAGQSAAERAVRQCLQQGLECRVLVLPEGADPCDWFARHDAEAFEQLIERSARSSVAFLAQRILSLRDARQPGVREQAAAEVLEITATIVDPVRRASLVAEVARACGVDRNLLGRGRGVDMGAPAMQAQRRPQGPARTPSASLRAQFVVVAGLATESEPAAAAAASAELDALIREGVLVHPGALRLVELARALGAAPVDPAEWIASAAEQEPELAPWLERVLLPPPAAAPLPGFEEAVSYLRGSAERAREQQARRDALSRPDIAHDSAALAALDASLRARSGHAAGTDHSPTATTPGTP